MCRPSGDQAGLVGCLISTNCSMVSFADFAPSCAAAQGAKESATTNMISTTLLRLAISPHFAEYRVEIPWTQFGAAHVRTSPSRRISKSNQAAPLKRESQAKPSHEWVDRAERK